MRMRQQTNRRITTRIGNRSAGWIRASLGLFYLTYVFQGSPVFADAPALDTCFRFGVPLAFFFAAAAAFVSWGRMVGRREKWAYGEPPIENSAFILFPLTVMACLQTLLALRIALFFSNDVSLSSLLPVLGFPLLWGGVLSGWKCQRERRAIEAALRNLTQTRANIPAEKACHERAAEALPARRSGDEQPNRGRWWTDAGTRNAVQQAETRQTRGNR